MWALKSIHHFFSSLWIDCDWRRGILTKGANFVPAGIYNYEEYLLVRDTEEAEKERSVTLKRAHHQSSGLVGTLRDADKMEKLRKELHTDDEGEFARALALAQGRVLIGCRCQLNSHDRKIVIKCVMVLPNSCGN